MQKFTIPKKPDLPKINSEVSRFSLKKDAIKLTDAHINYDFLYQSYTDTPFLENNISQHNLFIQINASIANLLPVQIKAWSRQTNSGIYRDITDFQILYDNSFFGQQLKNQYRQYVTNSINAIRNPDTEKLFEHQLSRIIVLQNLFQSSELKQKLVEAEEILSVPDITINPSLPDSINRVRTDSLKENARQFIAAIKLLEVKTRKLQKQVDSFQYVRDSMITKIKIIQDLIETKDLSKLFFSKKLNDSLDAILSNSSIPPYLKWLSGIRKLNLGRSPLTSSELTAKNISINGLNFEYNSWYYFSIAAGGIDYRFREISFKPYKQKFSPFLMARIGLGRVDNNYIILSAFSGKKPFPTLTTPNRKINVSGLSIEGKTQIGRNSYLLLELAQSRAPNYRMNPYTNQTKMGFSKQGNNAVSIKLNSYFPTIKARFEGMFKKSGSNFQSFSTWQVNTALESWHVKWDQYLLKRRLRIAASIRNNEFSNPYLTQSYESNTLFKSVTATLRIRKWPVLMLGYVPVSQLAFVGEQVLEAKFQTLIANLYHSYRIGEVGMLTQFVYNKYFNNADTVFSYSNTTSISYTQTVFFKLFTSSISFGETKNSRFSHLVLDHKIQFPIPYLNASFGAGVKVANYNRMQSKLGGSFNTTFTIFRKDQLNILFERSFIPMMKIGLLRNDMGSIQYIKTFSFSKSKNNLSNNTL